MPESHAEQKMKKKSLDSLIQHKIKEGIIRKCPRCYSVWEEMLKGDDKIIISYVSIKYEDVVKEEYHKFLCKY